MSDIEKEARQSDRQRELLRNWYRCVAKHLTERSLDAWDKAAARAAILTSPPGESGVKSTRTMLAALAVGDRKQWATLLADLLCQERAVREEFLDSLQDLSPYAGCFLVLQSWQSKPYDRGGFSEVTLRGDDRGLMRLLTRLTGAGAYGRSGLLAFRVPTPKSDVKKKPRKAVGVKKPKNPATSRRKRR